MHTLDIHLSIAQSLNLEMVSNGSSAAETRNAKRRGTAIGENN